MATNTGRRRTSAGPVLQSEVTDAIQTAFFEELAEVGYGRLSIDAVAKRAGVGKAAIYRRWRSKLDITVALTSAVAVDAIDVPDTGGLRGDIRQYLENACEALTHPLARHIVPDLLAEATRNAALADALLHTVRTPRRAKGAILFQRAIERGELSDESDLEMCMDLLAGPLYWRLTVVQTPTGADYLDRLTDSIMAALTPDNRRDRAVPSSKRIVRGKQSGAR
jgi:AcrR family transcriptional regulator